MKFNKKKRVREWTPQITPRTRAGVTKKAQKAELKKKKRTGSIPRKLDFFKLADKERSRRTTTATSISSNPGAPQMASPTHTINTALVAKDRGAAAGGTLEDTALIIYVA